MNAGPIAQLAEHRPLKPGVAGSNPARASITWGDTEKRSTSAVCKTDASGLRRFESCSPHHYMVVEYRCGLRWPPLPAPTNRGRYPLMADSYSIRSDRVGRFWSKVERRGPDECWPWRAAMTRAGYGMFSVAPGKSAPAHRVAWNLTHGPIAEGAEIRHKCDNRACCNPSHLLTGSHLQNMQDAVERGRIARGKRNASTRLTIAGVREIRRRGALGEGAKSISEDFPVARRTVHQILSRQTWAWVE